MSIEELLTPRYEFRNDYPLNKHFKVGEIITLDRVDDREHLAKKERYVMQTDRIGYPTCFYESEFDKFPYLFRKVRWWEYRDEKDLPKYVKLNGQVKMVTKWSIANSKTVDLLWDETNCCCDVYFFKPATEEEYLEFKKGEVANV